MRNVHKQEVLQALDLIGIEKSKFEFISTDSDLKIIYRDKRELFFLFTQDETDINTYGCQYGQYNRKFTSYNHPNWMHFDEARSLFTSWLRATLSNYIQDQKTIDPFADIPEQTFEFFEPVDSQTEEQIREDELQLTEIEAITFVDQLEKFQKHIELNIALQGEQLDAIKSDIKLLIEKSKTESKGELKKGIKKFFADLAVKVLTQIIVEGGKYFLQFVNQAPMKGLPSPEQFLT